MTIEALLSLFVLTIGALAVANFTIVSLKLTALQTAVVAGARQAALANLTVPRADATFAVMQPICSAHGISDSCSKATLSFSTSGSGQFVVVCEIRSDRLWRTELAGAVWPFVDRLRFLSTRCLADLKQAA